MSLSAVVLYRKDTTRYDLVRVIVVTANSDTYSGLVIC